MADLRAMGLAAAVLAASGGLALAGWGYLCRRRRGENKDIAQTEGQNSRVIALTETEPETPDISKPGELETPDIPKPGKLETPDIPKPGKLETPDISKPGKLETPDIFKPGELETPDIPKPGKLETPDIPKPGKLETPDIPKPGELETPDIPKPGKLETPDIPKPGELETPDIPKPGELETPDIPNQGKLETPDISKPGKLETPDIPKPGKLETPDIPKPGKLETPDIPKPGELETPDIPKPGELETPDISKPGELETPDISKPGELETTDIPKSKEVENQEIAQTKEKEIYDHLPLKHWVWVETVSTELCRQSISEDSDFSEEDIEAELAIIHGQMAYVLQLQGKSEDAIQLYNQIIKLKPTDIGLLAVVANNIITVNKDQNVFDSKKKVKLTNAEGVEHKLSKHQLQAIEFNKALLSMYTNQAEQCRKLATGLQAQNPEYLLPVLIQAAQLCREKQHSRAVDLLQEFADQYPLNAAQLKLTMAQLKLAQGNVTKACMILKSIKELEHKLGMVSALVTMHSHDEDIDSAIEVFSQAISWYQENQPNSPTHLSLIREAANFKLKHGRKKEAINDLEQLWKQNPKDIHTLAQLISAYSLVDAEKAKVLSKHLPPSDTMTLKVDVDALENSTGATFIRKKAAKIAGEQAKEQGQGDLKKKKKKKKGKLPKNYDPKVTPDAERWLPMRERSYYRGKKKGKKKDQIGKGTQGATAAATAEFDASKTASSPPTSPRPGTAGSGASTSNVVPPRHQKPVGAGGTKKKQQQKKKKGGKGGW
ncbi:signal recognition particle subunit SRP72 [Pelobates cultripes]|uniref:Signal recognition particle subunit SRP72 n=1 Tax=Pelobates cultripes TaxID=61616 RepID=A0AAD1S8I3_PELCU|nr:signal recognition particle subunit SRP72 [Pelobates cultripes]